MRPVSFEKLMEIFSGDIYEGDMSLYKIREAIRLQEQKDDWISVKDKLPNFAGKYLCYIIFPKSYGGKWQGTIKELSFIPTTTNKSSQWGVADVIVTHWRETLDKPEEM